MIFGKKNCNYNNDWKVRLNLINKDRLDIAEQLLMEEAKKIYEEVKKQLQDKSDFIEIETEQNTKTNNWEFFSKINIVSVEVYRDD